MNNKKIDAIIKQRTLIKANIEDVYNCFATSQGLDSWFCDGSKVDVEAGEMLFVWKNWGPDKLNDETPAKILKAEKPFRFSFSWWLESFNTVVDIKLKQTNDGVILELEEDGYPDTPEGRAGLMDCATGWGEAITLIKFFLEHGVRY